MEPQTDTRKTYKVLKDWDVTDTTLSYYGLHQVGDTVSVHEDVAASLVEEGVLELVEFDETEAPAETAPAAEATPAEAGSEAAA